MAALLESLRGLIEQIILTHQHYDHVGLAHTVRERSGATVVAHHLLPGFLADLPGSVDASAPLAPASRTRAWLPSPQVMTGA